MCLCSNDLKSPGADPNRELNLKTGWRMGKCFTHLIGKSTHSHLLLMERYELLGNSVFFQVNNRGLLFLPFFFNGKKKKEREAKTQLKVDVDPSTGKTNVMNLPVF